MIGVSLDREIKPVALLRLISATDAECVVRWILGDESELPLATDLFDVELRVDGAVVGAATVKPRLHVMLDPSRGAKPLPPPGDPQQSWMSANKPVKPIDPAASDDYDVTGQPVGVIHLLKGTATSAMRGAATVAAYQAFLRARDENDALRSLDRREIDTSARAFATQYLASGVRPMHLRAHASREYRKLRGDMAVGRKVAADSIFKLARSQDQRAVLHTALILTALRDDAFIERLKLVVDEPAQVRNHIRIASLHGGSMADYWADPDNAGHPIREEERGQQHVVSEMLGLGCGIPLEITDIEAWMKAGKILTAHVAMRSRPPVPPLNLAKAANSGGYIELASELDADGFGPGKYELGAADLYRALKVGVSVEARPPSFARIDYDLFRVESPTPPQHDEDFRPHQTGYRTGDGKVEIEIGVAPPGHPTGRSVAAYNVYGVWEGAPGFDDYFKDPAKVATIEELRPWLVTRRYSYARDLLDAFPPLPGGATHPGLERQISQPSWHPQLRRVQNLQNRTALDATPLPDTMADDVDAVFSLDIRHGMGMSAPHRIPLGWDLAAPLAAQWTCEQARDMAGVKLKRPQGYRFWVTSVDAFDQESTPFPVSTVDPAFGGTETYIFRPLRRAPLLSPPGGQQSMSLVYDEASKTATLNFETPYENEFASQASSGATPRVDKTGLEAFVAYYRRVVVKPIKDEANLIQRVKPALPDLPQWRQMAADLEKDSWILHKTARLDFPANGDIWTTDLALDAEDRGFEYRAAVGVMVRANKGQFWFPSKTDVNDPLRQRTLIEVTATGTTSAATVETPGASAIALSSSFMLYDVNPPLSPQKPKIPAIFASAPISAPPAIRRDLVLQRLLTAPYADHAGPVETTDWLETGIKLSPGQIAMCEYALKRTPIDGATVPASDPRLWAARYVLARDFKKDDLVATSAGERPRQHASIGFRGLVQLRWTYKPRLISGLAKSRSEAVQSRIYSASIPSDTAMAETFATLAFDARAAGGNSYRMTGKVKSADSDHWQAVANSYRPAIVQVISGTTVITVPIKSVDLASRTIELASTSGGWPAQARLRVFLSQPLVDVPITDFGAVADYEVLLPVAGGAGTTIYWWVSGVAALGHECERSELDPPASQKFAPSIEPAPPTRLAIVPPVDKLLHSLDPKTDAKWLPSDLTTSEMARNLPRLIVNWQPPLMTDGVFLEIQRQARPIAKPATPEVRIAARETWEIIRDIDGAAEGTAIAIEELSLLDGWLSGQVVEMPGEERIFALTPPDRRLSITDGVRKFPDPADPTVNLPAMIDYFGLDDEQRIAVMDGNWDYAYRLRGFIDLGPAAGAQRYLYSTPTPWSERMAPETPPIRLKPGKPVFANPEGRTRPAVSIQFDASQALRPFAAARAMLASEYHWEYRVIVRRKLTGPIIGTSAGDSWVDVGGPRSFAVGAISEPIIDDVVDRDWPDHEPTFTYRVFIQQFMNRDGAEKLVRNFQDPQTNSDWKDVPVTLPKAGDLDKEVLATIKIEIA